MELLISVISICVIIFLNLKNKIHNIENMYIFGFDDILIETPKNTTENVELLEAYLGEKINKPWYSYKDTLNDYLFDININHNITNIVKDEYNKDKNIVILFSNRKVMFKRIIKRILNSYDIKFHNYVLNNTNNSDIEFKLTQLHRHIYTFPNLKYIEIYENNKKHIEVFEKFLKTKNINYKINFI